jgi:hypothetical protein
MTDMKYVRLFAGPDGETHFEDVAVEFHSRPATPPVPPSAISDPQSVDRLAFVSFPPGWRSEHHHAPRRQFLVFKRVPPSYRRVMVRFAISRPETFFWPRTLQAMATRAGITVTTLCRPYRSLYATELHAKQLSKNRIEALQTRVRGTTWNLRRVLRGRRGHPPSVQPRSFSSALAPQCPAAGEGVQWVTTAALTVAPCTVGALTDGWLR